MSATTDSRGAERIIVWCCILALLGLVIAHFWDSLFPFAVKVTSTTQPVEVGERFNALGAIFTLLAFVGLVGALLLQRADLDFQRKESDRQKKDAAEQQKYLDDERNRAAKDQIRREVFQLMEAWQELVHHTGYKRDTDGRLAFSVISDDLRRAMEQARAGRPLSQQRLRHAYEAFYQQKNKAALGHYFRLLYHILRYINRSKATLDWKERKQLARLIRAHLSEPEFHLLFWNAQTVHGDKMFPLIEKYDLLQNYSFDPADVREEEIQLYPKTYARLVERKRKDAKAMGQHDG